LAARTYCTETRAEEGECLEDYWTEAARDGHICPLEIVELTLRIGRNSANWGEQAGERRYAVAFLAGGFPALENYHSQVNKIGRALNASGAPGDDAPAAIGRAA
jgi:hypothetical protein